MGGENACIGCETSNVVVVERSQKEGEIQSLQVERDASRAKIWETVTSALHVRGSFQVSNMIHPIIIVRIDAWFIGHLRIVS